MDSKKNNKKVKQNKNENTCIENAIKSVDLNDTTNLEEMCKEVGIDYNSL